MTKLKPFLITIALMISAAIVVWLAYSMGKKSKNEIPEKVLPSPTEALISATPTQIIINNGFIEGSLGFPSEGIPEAMVICAENISNNETACTNNQLKDSKYTYGLGYKIEIAPGNYHVYAYVPDFNQNYRAYYSEFVTCGFSIDCPSHNPIAVEVTAGSTVENVDPQDWYNQ